MSDAGVTGSLTVPAPGTARVGVTALKLATLTTIAARRESLRCGS